MSTASVLGSLAGSLGEGSERVLPLGPGRWRMLFGWRRRPLLLPAAGMRAQQRGLRHFITKPLHRFAAELLLRADACLPGHFLPELHAGRTRDDDHTQAPPCCAAIQIGTPGPFQKAAALLMTETGRPIALAKIALQSPADGAVQAEAGWLRVLEKAPDIDGGVPRLLEEGVTDGGRRYLVTSVAPSTMVTSEFTPGHARFLASLRNVGMQVVDFELSAGARWLQSALADLEPHIGAEAASTLRYALQDCETPLLYWSGPYVASQGDFAPWNIRLLGERIYVFDWESGSLGASPLEDVLHYQLIERAVHGRALRARHMQAAIARAAEFAREAYPEWDWRPGVVSAFALGYLLGVILRYSVPDLRISYDHPVIRRYWRLVEERSAWMAN